VRTLQQSTNTNAQRASASVHAQQSALKKGEKIEVLTPGTVDDAPEIGLPPVSNEAALVADATENNPERIGDEADEQVPVVQWARVIKGGYFQAAGGRTMLKEGKELNSHNYNFRQLQRQGIKLEIIEGPETGEEFFE